MEPLALILALVAKGTIARDPRLKGAGAANAALFISLAYLGFCGLLLVAGMIRG